LIDIEFEKKGKNKFVEKAEGDVRGGGDVTTWMAMKGRSMSVGGSSATGGDLTETRWGIEWKTREVGRPFRGPKKRG